MACDTVTLKDGTELVLSPDFSDIVKDQLGPEIIEQYSGAWANLVKQVLPRLIQARVSSGTPIPQP